MKIDYTPLCKKITELIKAQIVSDGLVNTGTMLNSIRVSYFQGDFTIDAVDYFLVMNEKYKILDSVINSDEFVNYMSDYLSSEIEKNINLEGE